MNNQGLEVWYRGNSIQFQAFCSNHEYKVWVLLFAQLYITP